MKKLGLVFALVLCACGGGGGAGGSASEWYAGTYAGSLILTKNECPTSPVSKLMFQGIVNQDSTRMLMEIPTSSVGAGAFEVYAYADHSFVGEHTLAVGTCELQEYITMRDITEDSAMLVVERTAVCPMYLNCTMTWSGPVSRSE